MKHRIPGLFMIFILVLSSCGTSRSDEKGNDMQISNKLGQTIKTIKSRFDEIPEDRKQDLLAIANTISTVLAEREEINLVFICTHNSRRSHMAQLWAQTAAWKYGFENIFCYSGGTEATAFNLRAVKALVSAGMEITTSDNTQNPVYEVSILEGRPMIKAFSKKFTDPFNPQQDFVAVMVCSSADEACPFVPGADARFAIPYIDPKISDNTPDEEKTYAERSIQIAAEMFYMMSQVK
jgi:arsenate reductase